MAHNDIASLKTGKIMNSLYKMTYFEKSFGKWKICHKGKML